MTQYGYCRISRPQQSIERQIRNITAAYPAAVIVQEVHTRRSFEHRDEWNKLMKVLRPGDMIIFDSVSRMSGDEEEGVRRYMELYDKGIELVFLNEPHINTATYKSALKNQVDMTGTEVDVILTGINQFLITLAEKQIRMAFGQSEKEVTDLRTRTKGGLATARLNGKSLGRPAGKTYETQKAKSAKQDIYKLAKEFGIGNSSDKDIIRLLQINRKTYYKYKKELHQELEKNSSIDGEKSIGE